MGWVIELIVLIGKFYHPVFIVFALNGLIKFTIFAVGIYLVMKTRPLYWRCLFVKESKTKK